MAAGESDAPPQSSVGDGGAPDLQKLVQQYGGYHKIPRDEWTRYDADLEAAQERLRRLHRQVKAPKKADHQA